MKLAHSSQNQEDREPSGKSRFRRTGIYLLPNLLTTSALFAGFYAIIAAMSGRFEIASIVILVAIVFDGLDGRVARLTNTESDFGAHYDNLCVTLLDNVVFVSQESKSLSKILEKFKKFLPLFRLK